MDALHEIAWLFILIAAICALIIVSDLCLRPAQPLWIMNLVWPLTALYGGPLALVLYCQMGRGQDPRPETSVALGTFCAGAGCVIGNVLAEMLLPFVHFSVEGSALLGEWTLQGIGACVGAILFRYAADIPRRSVVKALQTGILQSVAWQVGVSGGMAIAILLIFKQSLGVGDPVFWWMMQLAAALGFCVAYPVNWLYLYMMKQPFFTWAAAALLCLTLLSWGVTGHRTIGRIAANHLSPSAKAAVHDLLGSQTLADVSNWADEVRSTPDYKATGPWHYIDLPLGLGYRDFSIKVEGMTEPNAYIALLGMEHDLNDPNASRDQKIVALKFVVHIVEDMHQPMHVSRAEDKGGNTIQVNYDGKGTNLHALWDSKLIDHQGLTDEQMTLSYDHIPPATIKQWQQDPVMQWIWESYQISTKLYAEAAQMKNHTIPDGYYESHLPIVKERIQKAGIRLAGLLNTIFKDYPVDGGPLKGPATDSSTVAAGTSTASDTSQVTICDKVFGGKYFSNSGMTLLNLGGNYPDQKMTIVIKGDDRAKFKDAPETYYDGKKVCVTGRQDMYKGKPEIVVTDPSQIQVN